MDEVPIANTIAAEPTDPRLFTFDKAFDRPSLSASDNPRLFSAPARCFLRHLALVARAIVADLLARVFAAP